MARPTKYTPRRVESILAALRDGCTRTAACQASGVSLDSLARWIQRYESFDMAIRQAEATAENYHVRLLWKAAEAGYWEAALFWLERRRPEDWSRHGRFETVLPCEDSGELERLIGRLSSRRQDPEKGPDPNSFGP